MSVDKGGKSKVKGKGRTINKLEQKKKRWCGRTGRIGNGMETRCGEEERENGDHSAWRAEVRTLSVVDSPLMALKPNSQDHRKSCFASVDSLANYGNVGSGCCDMRPSWRETRTSRRRRHHNSVAIYWDALAACSANGQLSLHKLTARQQ